ncbi:hypothetical protein [Bradymonas sediminis]|uniref:hypothetical protein n=1 Tax=Bradymonas sediminis TaxID=1548548 RepID=UPI001061151A|nr:hypothetical protein [Bradymonas sediminis]TDP61992.1 hypothetical protein DFR33_1158 [Bradymonas sediminis]
MTYFRRHQSSAVVGAVLLSAILAAPRPAASAEDWKVDAQERKFRVGFDPHNRADRDLAHLAPR